VSHASLSALLNGMASQYLFAVFGQVNRIDEDTLDLDDGSGTTIRVLASQHGLQTGDYACVRGMWDPVPVPPVLECLSGDVTKLR
jgi:hypothetical protein